MISDTIVFIKTQFAGVHRWKDAPEDCVLLYWHRHMFHVEAHVFVSHDNRDVEFFDLQQRVDDIIFHKYAGRRFEDSCEQIARTIMTGLQETYRDPNTGKDRNGYNVACVQVSEDGENGATIHNVAAIQGDLVDDVEESEIDNSEDPEDKDAEEPLVDITADDKDDPFANKGFGELLRNKDGDEEYSLVAQVYGLPFIGLEAEGPFRKEPTLFLPGDCEPKMFKEAFRRVKDIVTQIYLGAGNRAFVRADLWDMIYGMFVGVQDGHIQTSVRLFTVEQKFICPTMKNWVTQWTKDFPACDDPSLLLVSHGYSNRDCLPPHYNKEVNGNEITWIAIASGIPSITTFKNDPLFKYDRFIF